MSLHMFLEILRTFETLAAEVAGVRFERDMDSDVTCDMVSLNSLGVAASPGAGQTEIICRFATNVFLAQMILIC